MYFRETRYLLVIYHVIFMIKFMWCRAVEVSHKHTIENTKCKFYIVLLILILDAKWGWVDNAESGPLYYQERAPVPFVEEVDWTTGPVWKDMEKRKSLFLEDFEHRTLQSVAGRCADHVILASVFSHYVGLFGVHTMATVYR